MDLTIHTSKAVNPQNIHIATLGKNLHMTQLRVSKRTVETFHETIRRSYKDDDRNFTNADRTTDDYGSLCIRYGGFITHQSDINFPRCKFVSSVLEATKKMIVITVVCYYASFWVLYLGGAKKY